MVPSKLCERGDGATLCASKVHIQNGHLKGILEDQKGCNRSTMLFFFPFLCFHGSQGPYSLYQDQAANSLMKKVRCGYSVCDTDLQPMEA
ncbi:Uncharacterized protein TCM_008463 [Theobroma cacao]|uniref:Uncharacterized protein n=1 Tax=Theobroma cacao TaxID=3641 RepID=A0A061E531_THECC|nr:Uncharacterized protein TCM_008463 [Theobroma cacao]